jgi:diaminopimelate decarboxylase
MPWWENSFLKVKEGKLHLGRTAVAALAKKYGTPLYVYGRDRILANYRRLAAAFAGRADAEVRICYAMKANPHRGILDAFKTEGAWIDAVSPGEVREALAAGFPPERILFTGTSLGADDFREAFAVDGLVVNVDAIEQLEIMKRIRDRWFRARDIRVSLRWNPGIGRGFSPKVITAGKKSGDGTPIKFGIEKSKLLGAFEKAAHYGFAPIGLHQHLGSGWVKDDFPQVAIAVDNMIRQAAELESRGFALEFLDFGGGFGPRYVKEQGTFPLDLYARHIGRKMRQANLKVQALALEPGKYLVADAGVLLLRVEYIKESYGNLFACVNGGTYNTLPRSAIYAQAYHEIVNASRVGGGRTVPITIAGNLCETGDVFGKEIPMAPPKPGDILAVLCAGAYGRSMASHFNSRPIPREILI